MTSSPFMITVRAMNQSVNETLSAPYLDGSQEAVAWLRDNRAIRVRLSRQKGDRRDRKAARETDERRKFDTQVRRSGHDLLFTAPARNQAELRVNRLSPRPVFKIHPPTILLSPYSRLVIHLDTQTTPSLPEHRLSILYLSYRSQ